MASQKWAQVTLQPPFTDEVNQILDTAQDGIDILNDILRVIKEILEIAKLVASLLASNPLEQALKALIDQIEKLLEDLFEDARLHGILIPIQKQAFGLGVEVDLQKELFSEDETPTSSGNLEKDGKFIKSQTEYSNLNALDTYKFIDTSPYAVGGNRGFYRTLAESVKDLGDLNRPQYTDNFMVIGGCVLLGSRSLDSLYRLAALLAALLKLGDRFDPLRNAFTPAQNLRAKVIPLTTIREASGRFGVALNWDKLPPRFNFPFYNDEEAIVEEIIVIRSTDPRFRQKFSWSEVFPAQLPNDIKQYPESSTGASKVIKRIKNDGMTVGYVDTSEELREGTTYYYTLALRYKLNGVYLPVKDFSNTVRVFFKRPLVTAESEPPDWLATPSLLELFPVLEEIIGYIRLFLEELKTKSVSGPTLLDQLIEMIAAILKRGEEASAILQEILDILRALFNTEVGGLYATQITVDYGGMDAWLSELAVRMSNTTDTSRPPFDSSEDLVMGLVIVGGAPTTQDIEAITDNAGNLYTNTLNTTTVILQRIMELIFGSPDKPDPLGQSISPNPILAAIDTLETAVADLEKTTFTRNMSASKTSITTEEQTPKIVFDVNMLPTKTLC